MFFADEFDHKGNDYAQGGVAEDKQNVWIDCRRSARLKFARDQDCVSERQGVYKRCKTFREGGDWHKYSAENADQRYENRRDWASLFFVFTNNSDHNSEANVEKCGRNKVDDAECEICVERKFEDERDQKKQNCLSDRKWQ